MDSKCGADGVEVEGAFIGVGCNRIVGAAAWGPSGLVAFGAHHAVAILDPEQSKILLTLPGHHDLVNCVEWLPRYSCQIEEHGELLLLSGSADGAIIVWGYKPLERKWRRACELGKAHDKAVTCIAGYVLSPSAALIASSSSDGAVRVWLLVRSPECCLSLLQSIKIGSRAIVAVALAALVGSEGNFILALGGLDSQIYLYVGKAAGGFSLACELKGHQDWIRGLDFSFPIAEEEGTALYLASCAQDKYIRIWKIVPRDRWGEVQATRVSLKTYIDGPVFRVGEVTYQTSAESVLAGHEDWVYSVRWKPPVQGDRGTVSQSMCVLSASMDRTMMIWTPVSKSGIWLNDVNVGELEHTALGFYSGLWSPHGDAILAHGYGGSLHLWKDISLQGDWQPQIVPSGHFAPVVDLAWATTDEFLLSMSHDQTARAFAWWNRSASKGLSTSCSWHEIARPQIHGHDLNCLAVIKGKGNHRYVSGAEEKVARVFEAPAAFLDTLSGVSGLETFTEYIKRSDVLVLGANMSALGLSQKPIYVQGQGRHGGDNVADSLNTMGPVPQAEPCVVTQPPLEEHLVQNTLWPESHKLYGHGNELFSMSCNYAGSLLATACKASTADFADIWLWQTGSWRPTGRLHSHTLTVTQLEFSHDDRFLLSVSRDRHLSVFQLNPSTEQLDQVPYRLIFRKEAHKRIIWACAWSHCDKVFATGSRDKSVKVWTVEQAQEVQVKLVTSLPLFGSSVTSLAWCPSLHGKQEQVLAVGLESGLLELWKGTFGSSADAAPQGPGKFEMRCLMRIDEHMCHVATVHRLGWSNKIEEITDDNGRKVTLLKLASCGADFSVRILNIAFR